MSINPINPHLALRLAADRQADLIREVERRRIARERADAAPSPTPGVRHWFHRSAERRPIPPQPQPQPR